jgi:hypothetical protein
MRTASAALASVTAVVPAVIPGGASIPTLSSPVFNCSIAAVSVRVSAGIGAETTAALGAT